MAAKMSSSIPTLVLTHWGVSEKVLEPISPTHSPLPEKKVIKTALSYLTSKSQRLEH